LEEEDKHDPVVMGVTLESKGFRSTASKGFLSIKEEDMDDEVKGGKEVGGL
jgi:hypothetical protein